MNYIRRKICILTVLLMLCQICVSASYANGSTSPFDWHYGNVPSVHTDEIPFSYGTETARFGKKESDESFFFNTEYDAPFVPAIYDVSSVNIVNPYVEHKLDVTSDDKIHLSFEIARSGMKHGGYVQVYPYVDGGYAGRFAGGGYLMNNNVSNGVQIFGINDVFGNKDLLPLNAWNKFDYIFYCDYNGVTAVDVYFNGNTIVEKHIIDADASMNGNQIMTGLDRIRFCFNMKKENGVYPSTTTCVDNLICDTDFTIGKFNLESTNKSITIDNFYNTVKFDEAVSVSQFVSSVSKEYSYSFCSANGVLGENDIISSAYLRIEKRDTGDEYYYTILPSSDTELNSDIYYIKNNTVNGFAEMTVAELVDASKTTGAITVHNSDGTPAVYDEKAKAGMIVRVTSADGSKTEDYVLKYDVYKPYFGFDDITDFIPEYYNVFTKYYIPDETTENNPYSFKLEGGIGGKNSSDRAMVFTSEYNASSIPAMNGISAENILKPQLRFVSDAKELGNDDILHISFEVLRTGTQTGFQLQLVPASGKVNTSNGYPIRYRGGKYGLDIHGQTNSFNQTSDLPENGKWHKYDLVYYINHKNEGHTVADIYLDGKKLIDKKILDFNSEIAGNQPLSSLSQIRIWYGMTLENGIFPKTATAIDNFSVNVVTGDPDVGSEGIRPFVDNFEYSFAANNKVNVSVKLTNNSDMKNVNIILAQYDDSGLVRAEISRKDITRGSNSLSAEFSFDDNTGKAKIMCFADDMITPLSGCINVDCVKCR